ncbi:MAG: cupin domain-containing protein [Alphaproteobacteria bacterium]
MGSKPLFLGPDEGRWLQVLADRVRVLAAGAETGGRYEMFELSGTQGSGPPRHAHPWDEAYYVVDGAVEIDAGRAWSGVAGPGAFVLVPGEAAHSFRIASPTARFLVLTAAAGAGAFFEAMDREIGFPPPSADAVVGVATRHGLRPA